MKSFETTAGSCARLGVWQESGWTAAAVTAGRESQVSLLLYEKGSSVPVSALPFPENGRMGMVHTMNIKGLRISNYEYNFLIDGKVTVDPCARKITGRENFGVPVEEEHAIRCAVLSKSYDWGEDQKPGIPYEEALLYSLHVRGFTMQRGSGVRKKGTFAGIREKAAYFSELGINQIKLMPAYEFDEIMVAKEKASPYEEKQPKWKLNYWGYGPGNYFAPKSSYAASKDPAGEFCDMIKALHEKNIEVLMEFYFPVGTDVRLAVSSLIFWNIQYHVDGFQIIGDPLIAKAAAREPALSDTKLLHMYFPMEELFSKEQLAKKSRILGECNDGFQYNIRRFLKGDEGQLTDFIWRMRRNPKDCGVVNYITSHDGFTLADLVSYDERHNEANKEGGRDGCTENYSWNCGVEGPVKKKAVNVLRLRQMKNAMAMLLLAAGTPMLLAGDEFGNSQQGNNNPYCIDGPMTWLDWNDLRKNKNLWNFVKDLIAFRKKHAILHGKEELKCVDSLSCGYPDISYHGSRAWYGAFEKESRQAGILYCGQYADMDEFLYAAYNFHSEAHSFALPNLPEGMKWYEAVNTNAGVAEEGEETLLETEKSFEVPGRTVVVLIGRPAICGKEKRNHGGSSDQTL